MWHFLLKRMQFTPQKGLIASPESRLCKSAPGPHSMASGPPRLTLCQRVFHAELGSAGLSSLTVIVALKSVAKSEERKGGKYVDTKERIGIYYMTNILNASAAGRGPCSRNATGHPSSGTSARGTSARSTAGLPSASTAARGLSARSVSGSQSASSLSEHGRRRSKCKECCSLPVSVFIIEAADSTVDTSVFATIS